jgi:acetyl esterase/lipase
MRILAALLSLLTLGACSDAALVGMAAARSGIEEIRGQPYGKASRQAWDLYRPEAADPDGPVVIFIHGGAWTSGGPELYRFLGRRLAALGWTVAIPGYRLHPDVTFPVFVEDAAAAVAAIKRAVASDRPVFLMGHSAGAHIAALLALDPTYLAAVGLSPCADVAGLIGLAGPYDFLPIGPAYRAIFPEPLRAASQPIAFAPGRHPPALLLHGADDGVVEAADSTLLAEALTRGGTRATAKLYDGVGHIGIIAAFSVLLADRAPAVADIEAFVTGEVARGYPRCG